MRWQIFIVLLLLSPVALGQTVLLVSDNPADLAAVESIPTEEAVVTSEWGAEDTAAIDEVVAAAPEEVIIVGGVVAVPQEVEDALKERGLKTRRIAGKDRYETALEVADEMFGETSEVIVAQGDDPAGIEAAKLEAKEKGVPVVFTKAEGMPENVKQRLKAKNLKRVRLQPAPNTAEGVEDDLDEIAENVTVEAIDKEARAQEALDRATAELGAFTAAMGEVTDASSLAASKMMDLAESHLEEAQAAFDTGNFGKAFGRATASFQKSKNGQRMLARVTPGYLKKQVDDADAEIKQKGLEKAKEKGTGKGKGRAKAGGQNGAEGEAEGDADDTEGEAGSDEPEADTGADDTDATGGEPSDSGTE